MCHSNCIHQRRDGTCRFERNCPCEQDDIDIEDEFEEDFNDDLYLTDSEFNHYEQYYGVKI